jgi:hypothetical protein
MVQRLYQLGARWSVPFDKLRAGFRDAALRVALEA